MLSFHSFRATGHSGGAVSRGHLLVCDFAAGLHSVSSSVDALVCQPPPIPHRHPSPLPTSADTGLQINRGESHVEMLPQRALTLRVGPRLLRQPGVTFTLLEGGEPRNRDMRRLFRALQLSHFFLMSTA